MSVSAPTSRTRFAALSDQARACWLDPAEMEFCAHGFENASLNRIIAEAGESKGRTYHYFADKGDLFRATLERRLACLGTLDGTTEAIAGAEGQAYWTRIAELCRRLAGALQGDERLASLLRTLHQEAAAQRAFAEPLAQLRAQIERVLASGQSVGAVRDDLPLGLLADVALNLLVTVDRWFAINASDLAEGEEARLAERAFSLLMTPLLPPDYSGKTDT
ncbi:TetR/AcrR family transcriptional regulator [Rhodovulum sulfidophilum]|uniref:TetR/AcrR family transcriptional regulator n=1 Tax=Rhodovulum sulfidophilum TaxID=35806 RepID=UPI00117BCD3E|nr:TetR/AcrR family transcriptional regulator [Rhodovulum sulfidophilum]